MYIENCESVHISTTGPISAKLDTKQHGVKEIQVCANGGQFFPQLQDKDSLIFP